MVRPAARPAARVAALHAAAWLGIGVLTGGLLTGGCAEIPAPPRAAAPPSFLAASGRESRLRRPLAIGVLISGWHSGLLLPSGELGPLAPLLARGAHARYLNIGWGNRRFYMAAHPGSGAALAALFRSPSVLFVQSVSSPGRLLDEQARLHWLCADRAQLWRLDRYIEESLARPGGRPRDLGRGPFPGSVFYASTRHYSLVHTCNTWTVAALEYAGLPVRARGVIFAAQANARLRNLAACPAPQ
jgi:Protein of unknown function (DUF2459)